MPTIEFLVDIAILKEINKELEQKLAIAEGEWKTYATMSDSLSKKLVLAEAEVISRGENFNRVKDKLEIAKEALERIELNLDDGTIQGSLVIGLWVGEALKKLSE